MRSRASGEVGLRVETVVRGEVRRERSIRHKTRNVYQLQVCLEVYVNGEFYSGDSCWVPEEEDVQLEFTITDAIYDHFGSSAVISAQLEVDLPDDMSVSYSFLEGAG
ncbi:unnamed protein product [Leuciscus chuanchicus]